MLPVSLEVESLMPSQWADLLIHIAAGAKICRKMFIFTNRASIAEQVSFKAYLPLAPRVRVVFGLGFGLGLGLGLVMVRVSVRVRVRVQLGFVSRCALKLSVNGYN